MFKTDNSKFPNTSDEESVLPVNMRPTEAAQYTGISESTLAKLRMLHNRANGPKFVKLSGCIVYRRADLDQWLEQNAV